MGEKKDYTLPRMILCEGPEDVCFFNALIQERGIGPFHIEHTGETRGDRGGNSKFGEKLRTLRFNRTFKCVQKILLVTDSDEDSAAAFTSAQNQVRASGFVPPVQEGLTGPGFPAICIITMPRGGPGNLETCLLDAARVPDPMIAAFAEHFVNNVAIGAEWTQPKKDKLLVRTLVSGGWPRDPGINIAPMFRDRLARRRIPLEHQSFNPLVDFLQGF